MAINVLRGLRNRTAAAPSEAPDPAGSIEPIEALEPYDDFDNPANDTIRGPKVSCPNCGRTMGLFQTECPGCALRVLAGVPLQRGGLLVVAGCVGGLVVGLVLAVGIALIQSPAQAVGNVPAASAAAAASLDPSIDPGLVSGPVPPSAGQALRLTATVEDRLAASGAALRSQLKARSFSAVAAATTIRAIAADAAWGSDVADGLSGWPAAAPLRAQLSDSYDALRASARDALGVSITNSAKYKAAAKRMVKLLGSVAATRTAIETLGAANRLTIPPPSAP